MRTVCAWCGVLMRDGDGPDTSHGLCPACEAKLLQEDEADPLWPVTRDDTRFLLALAIPFVIYAALVGAWLSQ